MLLPEFFRGADAQVPIRYAATRFFFCGADAHVPIRCAAVCVFVLMPSNLSVHCECR